jgi:uncharacterized protein
MDDEVSGDAGFIEIEVAYAKPEQQIIVTINVVQGTTLQQAVQLSGLLERCPDIIRCEFKVGVFGVVCKPDKLVTQGDRVEIYRSLLHDPKAARRQRALGERRR